MEDIKRILKMWYTVYESFDEDVESSFMESFIDEFPLLMFDVALYCYKNKIAAPLIKKLICRKNVLKEFQILQKHIVEMDPYESKKLRESFVISVNNAYVLTYGKQDMEGVLLLG